MIVDTIKSSGYTYDAANRLVGVIQGANSNTFEFNSHRDRLSQTMNGVTPH
jgi:YD repeat-containing protein